MKRFIEALTGVVERIPRWVILAAIVLSLAAIPGALMLRTDSTLGPLVDPDSAVSKDTQRYQAKFGDEPITVILSGRLQDLVSPQNLARLNQFQQEFSSNHGCRITSPVTVLNQAVLQAQLTAQNLQAQIAQAVQEAVTQARQQAAAAGLNEAAQEAAAQQARQEVLKQFSAATAQLSQIGEPALTNPNFIAAVLYTADGSLNTAFAALIPDKEHALVVVTPTGAITPEGTLKMGHDIENYFAAHPLENVSTTLVGYALVTEEISQSMKSNLLILLGLAVLVMVIVLFLLFRVRWRLLSLLIVGLGALWTFGFMGYVSIPITMATMAVLPVLIGLGIDYPIQFHNRYQEELTRSKSVAQAVATSFVKMMPAVGIALLATAIGFATLYVSKIPMIRDFGIILLVGVIVCYLLALFLLYSVVFMGDRKVPVAKLGQISVNGSRIEKGLSRICTWALKYPLAIFLAALILGVGGGIADHWLPTNTDFQKLIPQDLKTLQNSNNLHDLLGIGGQVTFMVEADDVTSQDFLVKLKNLQEKELQLHSDLISASSPATLISSSSRGVIPPQAQIDQVLAATPPEFTGALISDDKKMASLSFTTKYITLDRIHDLLATMQDESKTPGEIQIRPVGTVALSAATVDSVIEARLLMDGLCLGAIFIILLLIYRRLVRTVFIMVSIGLVIGWSSLTMFIFNIPLNPLTAILGVIITAIGTEFMVLLTSRYEEEKAGGALPRQAMSTAVSRMGRAIVTTGITTLGGFGVLIASNFVLVRDFGIVTVVGIFLCLVSAIILLPSLMVWWDERKRPLKPAG